MECPKCRERFEPGEDTAPTTGQSTGAVLKDWRFWVLAVVFTVGGGMLGGAFGYPHGAAAGAIAMSFYFYFGVSGATRCPKCGAVFISKEMPKK